MCEREHEHEDGVSSVERGTNGEKDVNYRVKGFMQSQAL